MLAGETPDFYCDGDIERELTATVQRMLRQSGTPGATVVLVVDGRSVFARGIGSREVSGSAQLPTDARFYMYSVTKVLLAVIVLRLVEESRVALDNPVQQYLPALPFSTPVTVRQLLTHTAGLPDYGALPAYAAAVRADPGAPWSAEEFFAAYPRIRTAVRAGNRLGVLQHRLSDHQDAGRADHDGRRCEPPSIALS